MTPPLRCGQIVWAEMADANGVRKARPVVIVTPDDRLSPSGPLEVVAITSRLPQPLPDDHVLLPWHPRRHPRTRLNRKCAAVCSWLARIEPADIQSIAGLVPGPVFARDWRAPCRLAAATGRAPSSRFGRRPIRDKWFTFNAAPTQRELIAARF
jgi:mRNA-degrading endonuclease toxin of MazEF toxin-antitoxin module